MRSRQRTLDARIEAEGIGVHSGKRVSVSLQPAEADSGVVFVRSDLDVASEIPARYDCVSDVRLSTRLSDADGNRISTVEHLLSAFFVCGVDNARIELDAEEIPIMDGSAAPFAQLIQNVGIKCLDAPVNYLRILQPVSVEDGKKRVELSPYDGFAIEVKVDFGDKVIGRQEFHGDMAVADFLREVLPARTFAFAHEVETMRRQGLSLGGSLENAIVVGENDVMNEEGLRFENEFARHKALDALGDLFLAGTPLLGRYQGYAPGHALNNLLLRKLFGSPETWEYVCTS